MFIFEKKKEVGLEFLFLFRFVDCISAFRVGCISLFFWLNLGLGGGIVFEFEFGGEERLFLFEKMIYGILRKWYGDRSF